MGYGGGNEAGTFQLKTISLRTGWPLLAMFIVGVIGAGVVVGLIAAPPEGYLETLRIPDLIIPPAISGPLWLALAIAFAVAGWRLWTVNPTSTNTRLWLAIQILSWWFSPTFFVIRAPAVALVVITALCVLMLWFILRAWKSDRVSALLFIPCLLYVGYTAAMTAAIVVMN
jgi:benzodiazapine receptor